MIANSRNRVTSIKPSKVCWLKTASWDFMSPARRDLLKVAQMTGEWKRQRFLFNPFFQLFKPFQKETLRMNQLWHVSNGVNWQTNSLKRCKYHK